MRPGCAMRQGYAYGRGGTRDTFVAVEPLAGHRTVAVTRRRAKINFVTVIRHLAHKAYPRTRRNHLVLDGLKTQFHKTVDDVLEVERAAKLLRRLEFHYAKTCQLAQHGKLNRGA